MTDNFYREVIADTIWYAEKYKMTFKEALDDWEGDGPDGSWGLTNQEKTEILECYRETKQTH